MLRKKRPLIVWMLTLLFLLSQAGIAGAAPAGQAQPTGATPFTDISSTDKNALYINYMAKRGLITGFPDGTYHPGEGLTRAQAAVLFCKIRGLNSTDKDSTFSDVAGSHWAAGYIAAAVKAGYITGFPDGTYRPQAILTRAQGINLFLQIATEKDSSEEIPALQDLDKNHWAANSLAIALAAGMIEAEDNNIKPEQSFARGDLARALSILLTKDPGLNQQELIGKLKVKNGTVEIKRAGSEKAQTINTASIVRKGDTVITGKDGQAEINYPDGSGILLKPDSELIIKTSVGRAYILKDGRPGTAVEDLQVELTNGKLFGALASKYTGKEETEEVEETATNNKYKKIASRDKNFDLMAAKTSAQPWYKTAEKKKVKVKVDMPWGVAAIRGSFWSNFAGNNGCGMNLLQGDGSLSSGGQTQNLSPGQSSGSGSSGGPPSPPGPMSPSESREWSQQRGWVGERAGEMNNNQGASDPGSEGQGEGEGEGEGDDPGDEPPDNLMDNLNDALDQADQNAASGSSGSSGGSSSGGSPSGGQIIVSGIQESIVLPVGYNGSIDYCVSPPDAAVAVVSNTNPDVATITPGYCAVSSSHWAEINALSTGSTVVTLVASKNGYTSVTKQITIQVVGPAPELSEFGVQPFIFEGYTEITALAAPGEEPTYWMALSSTEPPVPGTGQTYTGTEIEQGAFFPWPEGYWLQVAAVDSNNQVIQCSNMEYNSSNVGQQAPTIQTLEFVPGPWVNTTVFSYVYDPSIGYDGGYKHTVYSNQGNLPFRPALFAPAADFDTLGYRNIDDYSWIAGSAGCHVGVLGYGGQGNTVVCFNEHILQASELSGTTEAPDVTGITFVAGDSSGTTKITNITPSGESYRYAVFGSEEEPGHPPAASGAPCSLGATYNLNQEFSVSENFVVWVFVLDSDDKIIAFTKHTMNASEIKTGP